MPFLQIFTTVSRTQIPENFPSMVAQLLSNTMRNKPLERVVVHIAPEQIIYSASTEPESASALAILRSMGSVDIGDNRVVIKELTKLINNQLHIDSSNIRLVFQNLSPDNGGVGGNLFLDLIGIKPN